MYDPAEYIALEFNHTPTESEIVKAAGGKIVSRVSYPAGRSGGPVGPDYDEYSRFDYSLSDFLSGCGYYAIAGASALVLLTAFFIFCVLG